MESKIQSINPATEEVNKELTLHSKDDVIGVCKASRKAFDVWRSLDIKERCNYLRRLAGVLKDRSSEYGRLITTEMGKPIRQAISEVEKCAWTAEVYADNAEKWLEDEIVQTDAKRSFVTFEPLGVILSIMPWNFPFWQAMRFGIPALAIGNTSVLKHSNTVPMCALAIEESFRLAGFPDNVFRTVLTDHTTAAYLIRSKLTDGVSLTGSVEAGSRVGSLAGKSIKKFVLELGGSDPFIVLEDADVESACRNALQSRIFNSGQSCIAAKRFIVAKKMAGEFTEKLAGLVKNLKVGDPLDEATDVGPMANRQQVEKLEMQVKDAVDKGGKLECGGKRMEGKGYFFEPAVISNTKNNMKVVREEVFGPVMPIIVVRGERQAIKVANSSEFGLGASIWTSDADRGERMTRAIRAGSVFVNGIVKSDPRMPFGGIKKSGIGRELSRYGLLEFANIKSVEIF